MASDARNLDSAASSWRHQPLPARLNYLESLVIPHPHFVRAVDAVKRALWRRAQGAPARGVYVEAPPGCGKSTFRRYLSEMYPPQVMAERTRLPYVGFEVPDPCQRVDFANAVLATMGDPDSTRRSSGQLARVVKLMKMAQTECILIDNAQDIPERRGRKGVGIIGNLLRDWSDKKKKEEEGLNIIIVLVGTYDGLEVLDCNPQLQRRTPTFIKLFDYPIDNPQGLATFLRLLHQFESQLPMAEPSDLAKSPLGKALCFAAGGRFGHMVDLLRLAMMHALSARRERILRPDLQAAYREHFGDRAVVIDPFEVGFDRWRLLNQEGEPHFDTSTPKKRS